MIRASVAVALSFVAAPAWPAEQAMVQDYLRTHEAQIVQEFEAFLRIPNVATDEANIRRNAQALMAMMKARNLSPRLLEGDSSATPPAVYGERLVPGATRTLVFYAHYDGQAVDPADWASDPWWKENFITLLQLGILNIAAFLVLGYRVFLQFINAVIVESRNLLWVLPAKQPVNHSINAFIDKLGKNNDSELPAKLADWVSSSGSWLGFILLAVIVLCTVAIIWRTLQNRTNLLHADRLMLLILLGFLLPSISMDYKLVLLAPGLAVVLANHTLPELRWQKIIYYWTDHCDECRL